jgi:hypothetical protein
LTISREMIDRVLEILSDVLEGVEKGD